MKNMKIVVTCSTQPDLARTSCSSFNVSTGLLAASPTSFLVISSSFFEGCPVLDKVTVVPYYFHSVMTVSIVLNGIFNTLGILLYPSPD